MFVICIYLFCQESDERAKIDRFLLAVLTECQINLLFFIALQKKKKRSLFGKTYVTYFYFLQKLRKREIFFQWHEKPIRTARKVCRESRSVPFGRVVQKLVPHHLEPNLVCDGADLSANILHF